MRTFLIGLLVILGIAAFLAYSSFFVVHQGEQAIVTEFGKPIRQVRDPGLNFKTPFIQKVEHFDKRLIDLETQPQEIIALGNKRLVVDAFARYRITDPLLYFQTLRDERLANSRLGNQLDSTLRSILGNAEFRAIVKDKREPLMKEIAKQLNIQSKPLGVEIVDVRIKRTDLPEANSAAIFRQMKTDREREAAQLRAEGEEQSRTIRANADRAVTVIIANATSESETIRGEGDAEKNRIFAEAFGRDPDFFGFYRAMQAYEQALKSGDTRLVLSPDSEFFRYFNQPSGVVPEKPAKATP